MTERFNRVCYEWQQKEKLRKARDGAYGLGLDTPRALLREPGDWGA